MMYMMYMINMMYMIYMINMMYMIYMIDMIDMICLNNLKHSFGAEEFERRWSGP